MQIMLAPSLLGGFVLIRDYHPLDVIKLHVPDELYCTLLHPHFELNTADSRSVLRDQVPMKVSTIQSGKCRWIHSWLISGRRL